MSTAADRTQLVQRARFAYESGRLWYSVRYTWTALTMMALSIVLCHEPYLSAALGVTLFVLTTGLIWRGGTCGRSAITGLKVGCVAFALPVLTYLLGLYRLMDPYVVFAFIHVGSGFFAGVMLGARSARLESGKNAYLALGATVAVLSGMLGCMLFGTYGIIGISVGALAATVPWLAYRHVYGT